MKKITGKNVPPIRDFEYSTLLREIAVRIGLQLPETPEEVQYFEDCFSEEILAADQRRPSLASVLALADKLKRGQAPLAIPNSDQEPNSAYTMAARNGNGITPETEELMERALQRAREMRNDEH